MTQRISELKKYFIEERAHHKCRRALDDPNALAYEFERQRLPDWQRAVARLIFMLENNPPLLFPQQTIAFARTLTSVAPIFTPRELEALKSSCRLHEQGEVCNICVDYTGFLRLGFAGMRRLAEERHAGFVADGRQQQADYLAGQLTILSAMEALIAQYQRLAGQEGNTVVADCLARLLDAPPQTLHDALQMQRIIHYTMWCGGNYHNTLGRFDQYMLHFLEGDMAAGRLTEDTALELLEEYFLSFNIDSDLYPGMQQGDNGQSMVLGGLTPQGGDGFNLLSRLCLQASLELRLIDPKINLRVSKSTPLDIYRMGTQLTKQGLGFPQYSNDDIIIPGLERLGYSAQDARNYAVAACWEFIIPGLGMDIPNIDSLCFAQLVRDTVRDKLNSCDSYDQLFAAVRDGIVRGVDELCENTRNLYMFPAPFISLMMEGCLEKGQDISLGGVYNNYGFHGTGLATAVDSLAAVQQYVYQTGQITKAQLLDAMENDFAGQDSLLHTLRFDAPKMGNDEYMPDSIACELLQAFSEALEGRVNERGGIFRAGTGSAMYYLLSSREMGATPDGRRAGEGFSANYSPSLFMRSKGPVSIIKSFTKPDLKAVVNGGPLTIELHDTLFRSEDSVGKVAALVKSFIDLGGHQLQINAVNRDTMKDAQLHPENHRNLIVRVWGWSGYFVELDKSYQDHIIQRMELAV